MARKHLSAKPTVAQLLQQASGLSPEELVELKAGIDALGAKEQETEQEVDEHGKPSNQQGYIEEKLINGCGPYRYLRFWSGKKHRSVYLGKTLSHNSGF